MFQCHLVHSEPPSGQVMSLLAIWSRSIMFEEPAGDSATHEKALYRHLARSSATTALMTGGSHHCHSVPVLGSRMLLIQTNDSCKTKFLRRRHVACRILTRSTRYQRDVLNVRSAHCYPSVTCGHPLDILLWVLYMLR